MGERERERGGESKGYCCGGKYKQKSTLFNNDNNDGQVKRILLKHLRLNNVMHTMSCQDQSNQSQQQQQQQYVSLQLNGNEIKLLN